jgi:hypothetical protein
MEVKILKFSFNIDRRIKNSHKKLTIKARGYAAWSFEPHATKGKVIFPYVDTFKGTYSPSRTFGLP